DRRARPGRLRVGVLEDDPPRRERVEKGGEASVVPERADTVGAQRVYEDEDDVRSLRRDGLGAADEGQNAIPASPILLARDLIRVRSTGRRPVYRATTAATSSVRRISRFVKSRRRDS